MLSDDISVSIRDLTKTYRIFGQTGDRIKQALTFGVRRYHNEYTALKDISFDVRKGEIIGIIGRNGSGKSTLLQLICGILKPTSGTIETNGRVSALLELGAGFNPEFTGRENVFFQGALMGISREQMESRFDDIAAFADIGEFIEQPVRTYSSGMFVRLAFSVAINVAPDILIIDEALSVGDASFQNKCLKAVKRFSDSGASILLVSHDVGIIRSKCNNAVHIDDGRLVAFDSPGKVCDGYLRDIRVSDKEIVSPAILSDKSITAESATFRMDNRFMESHISSRYGSGEVRVTCVDITDENDIPIKIVEFGQVVKIRLSILPIKEMHISIGYKLRDRTLNPILASSTLLETERTLRTVKNNGFSVEFITTMPIRAGDYSFLVQIVSLNENADNPIYLDVVECAAFLKVLPRKPHSIWSSVYVENKLVISD